MPRLERIKTVDAFVEYYELFAQLSDMPQLERIKTSTIRGLRPTLPLSDMPRLERMVLDDWLIR